MRNFSNFTAAEGIPQSQVRTALQDSRSFLWIGTYGGLSRFDGVAFRTYTQRDGLRSNTVVALAEDIHGRVVTGLLGGGVCTMLESGFRCLGLADGLPGLDVRDVLATPDGGIWIATETGIAFADSSGTVRGYPAPTNDARYSFATTLARGADGTIWVGTDGGLLRLAGDRLVRVPDARLGTAATRLLLPIDSGLLVGTPAGLFTYANGVVAVLPGTAGVEVLEYTSAARDASGDVWISTRQGALRYDGTSLERLTQREGLLLDELNTVVIDREGDIWFGTEAGLSKLTPGPFDHFTVREGLPNAFVRALAEDANGTLWAGTRDGVAWWKDGRFRTLPLPRAPDLRVYGLAPLPDGSMLIGTRGGLIHHRGGVQTVFRESEGMPGAFVLSVLTDPAGGAWVGTNRGIVRWEAGRIMPVRDTMLSSTIAIAMAYDRRGRLWVGARAGGVLIHDANGTTRRGSADGLSDESTWSLAEDDSGGMWVASNGDGAFRVAPDGTVRRLTAPDGLPNDFVWQVLVDRSGAVWFSTNRGLARYADGRSAFFGREDGLVDLEGTANAAFEDRSGVLWFGTGSGVLRFRRQLDVAGTAPPPVYIEGASAGTQSLALDDVRVRPRDGVLRIRYSSPSLRDPQGVRFRYRLVNMDDDWSELTSDRVAAYAKLSPGRHVFEVQAITGSGVASGAPASLAFTVLPLVRQTWWFRLSSILVLAGAIAGFLRARLRQHRRERELLEELVHQRTDDLRAQTERLEQEVVERRAAEQERGLSEARLRDIVEHSTNVFYSHTPEHELTYMSPQSLPVLGLQPEEALRRWTELATDNPENQRGIELTQRAIDTGEKQPPYELELRHADGRSVWVQVNEAPVVRNGRTTMVVGSLTNITEARQARESEEQLQAQLRQAQKMEAVGRLAGGIAHDFNNLLTSVIGNAELLASQLEQESPLQVDLGEIQRASERAAALVAQLMAFSRQQLVQRRVLDVNVAVAESSRMLQRLVGSDIRLDVRVMCEPAWVLADHGQLDQVLLNLAANARDAMPAGGSLSITTECVEALEPLASDTPAGTYIRLTVQDTGHGMDEATLARVFEPFFSTKELGRGTGLGLAMVYGIAKQNDGHVAITSSPTQGTAVRLYLRRADAPPPTVGVDAPTDKAEAAGDQRVVLIVDDDDAIRRLTSRTLTASGFHVLQAPEGESALAASARFDGRIDLLLTDVIMPGMHGIEVAQRVTQRRPDTRVLFMSGHAEDILGSRGIIADDRTRLLQKPFGGRDLVRAVQEALEGE